MNAFMIGVVADSHIPDRQSHLHPALIPRLQEAGVQQILHAGDISLPRVLRELEEVASVLAVRGNRDWFGFKDLPLTRVLDIQGKRIGLTHGHGGLGPYLLDKARFLMQGPQAFSVFLKRSVSLLPNEVDAIVFGHTHAPMMEEHGGKLILNPGSACCQIVDGIAASFGLLEIRGDVISGEIVYLD